MIMKSVLFFIFIYPSIAQSLDVNTQKKNDAQSLQGHIDEFDFLKPRWQFTEEKRIKQSANPFVEISPDQLPKSPFFGDLKLFTENLERQIKRCSAQSANTTWNFAGYLFTRKKWCIDTAQEFLKIAEQAQDWTEFMELAAPRFHWFKSRGATGNSDVLFTGYYLPTLHAKRKPSSLFYYPLYLNPGASLARAYDRKEIDLGNKLRKQNFEILYIDNHIMPFFLHIQGSGRIVLHNPDGSTENFYVTYNGQNGKAYVPIGRILRDEGKPRSVFGSLQGLREYFWKNINETTRIFPMNPSYIYFREDRSGVRGSGAVYLEPKHSIATDNSLFPLGAIGLVETERPTTEDFNSPRTRFNAFVVNQDTGGAIKGAGRVDFFWGAGEYAETAAGGHNDMGQLIFAVLK